MTAKPDLAGTISGTDLLVIESLRADVARLTAERDEHKAARVELFNKIATAAHVMGVPDNGQYRADWQSKRDRLDLAEIYLAERTADLASRDATIAELRAEVDRLSTERLDALREVASARSAAAQFAAAYDRAVAEKNAAVDAMISSKEQG